MTRRSRDISRFIREHTSVALPVLILNIICKCYLAMYGFICFVKFCAKRGVNEFDFISLAVAFCGCIIIDYCLDQFKEI